MQYIQCTMYNVQRAQYYNDGCRYAPKPRFSTPRGPYTASLEALLIGHEDWVHSVQWQPPPASSSPPQRAKHAQHKFKSDNRSDQQSCHDDANVGDEPQHAQQDVQELVQSQHAERAQQDTGSEQPLCLMSTSMDRTMMLWRPDPATGNSHACMNVEWVHTRGVCRHCQSCTDDIT